jgi:hypothetical protein
MITHDWSQKNHKQAIQSLISIDKIWESSEKPRRIEKSIRIDQGVSQHRWGLQQ